MFILFMRTNLNVFREYIHLQLQEDHGGPESLDADQFESRILS